MELLGKIIDKILEPLFDGLLEPFITKLFDALGLDDLLAKLPDVSWFDAFPTGLGDFAEKIHEQLSGYYDEVMGQIKPYMDIR